jgi:putative transcriptional regulator
MTMAKAAFDKIAEGLTEALAIARDEAKPSRLYVPPEIDVRCIRMKAGMTQDDFAPAYGFTVHQIRQWEQGRSRPLGAMRAYLMLIEQNPRGVLNLLHAAKADAAQGHQPRQGDTTPGGAFCKIERKYANSMHQARPAARPAQ